MRRFASFSKRYQQLKGNPELQATELPSMHFGTASRNAGSVSRHPAHEYIVFAKIPTTYIGATCPKPPTCRTPNLCPSSTFSFPTSHFAFPSRELWALMGQLGGWCSRRRHTTRDRRRATRVDHPPSYGPCTWHCLEKRRRRFGVSRHPNTRIDAELQATATYRFPQQALKSHIPTTFSLRPI